MAESYEIVSIQPLADGVSSSRVVTHQSYVSDPAASAERARDINGLAMEEMTRPGMERLVPRQILGVGRSTTISRARPGARDYDRPGHATGAGALDKLASERIAQFGRAGIVPFDARGLAKLASEPDGVALKSARQALAEKSAVATLLTSREPEVHQRVLSVADAKRLSEGFALEPTKGEATFHVGTGQNAAAREGYIYGAVTESRKDYPVLTPKGGNPILAKAILGDLEHFPSAPANIDKIRGGLPGDAHVIIAHNIRGATDRTLIIGMPAAKVADVRFANYDGELRLQPGADAAGASKVLATITLNTGVSIHGGHELPKLPPAMKTTHEALKMGTAATPADVAALTARAPEPQLMSFASVAAATPSRPLQRPGARF